MSVLLADSTFSDAGAPTVRSYYTFPLAAGYNDLYAIVTVFGNSWSTTASLVDEGGQWWNTVIAVGGPYVYSDPDAAHVTDGYTAFRVSTNNTGGIQTMNVKVYGTLAGGGGGDGGGSGPPSHDDSGEWLRLVHHG